MRLFTPKNGKPRCHVSVFACGSDIANRNEDPGILAVFQGPAMASTPLEPGDDAVRNRPSCMP